MAYKKHVSLEKFSVIRAFLLFHLVLQRLVLVTDIRIVLQYFLLAHAWANSNR